MIENIADSGAKDWQEPRKTGSGIRRLVLFLPGHDPTDMNYHHGRFVNQAERFGTLWSVATEVTERLDGDTLPYARWAASSHGPNWQASTDYRILRWEDIIHQLDARPDPVRLWRGFGGLWDFLVGGAARRYFTANLRYGIFFFFPYLIVGLFMLAGAVAGVAAGWGAGLLSPALAWPAGIIVAVLAFFALFHRPGRDWRLHQALDDWDLARNYLHERTPQMDTRLDAFAGVLVEEARSGRHDEIILVGHSLGATLMLGVLDRALNIEPRLAQQPGTRLGLLTCGATIPKLGLHARGDKVRRQAQRAAKTKGLTWVEYQARHDAINFYKFHPVTLRRASFEAPEPIQPMLRNANIKEMLSHEKLKRLRWHMMRLHYQFLLANERQAAYDYFMFVLGPLPFAELSSRPEGPLGRFAPDGSLIA